MGSERPPSALWIVGHCLADLPALRDAPASSGAKGAPNAQPYEHHEVRRWQVTFERSPVDIKGKFRGYAMNNRSGARSSRESC